MGCGSLLPIIIARLPLDLSSALFTVTSKACITVQPQESVRASRKVNCAVSDSHKHVEHMSRGLGFHGRENALSFSFIKVVFTLIILNKEFKNTRYRVCVIKVDCC